MKYRLVMLLVAMVVCWVGLTVHAEEYVAYVVASSSSPSSGEHDRLIAYDQTGAILWQTNDAAGSGYQNHRRLMLTNDALYASAWTGGRIDRFERTTGFHNDAVAMNANDNPSGMDIGSDGLLYLTITSGTQPGLHQYDATTLSVINYVFAMGAGYSDLAFDSAGNIHISNGWYVDRLDPPFTAYSGGVYFSEWVYGLTRRGTDIYVCVQGGGGGRPNEDTDPTADGYIGRIDASYVSSTFVTVGSGGLQNPYGLAFTPGGTHLLVCDRAPSRVIRRYDGTTGAFIDNFATLPDGLEPWDVVIAAPPSALAEDFNAYVALSDWYLTAGDEDRVIAYDAAGNTLWETNDATA